MNRLWRVLANAESGSRRPKFGQVFTAASRIVLHQICVICIMCLRIPASSSPCKQLHQNCLKCLTPGICVRSYADAGTYTRPLTQNPTIPTQRNAKPRSYRSGATGAGRRDWRDLENAESTKPVFDPRQSAGVLF